MHTVRSFESRPLSMYVFLHVTVAELLARLTAV